MRTILIFVTLWIASSGAAAATTPASFWQQPTTTKRRGATPAEQQPPAALPATVGVPTPTDPRLQELLQQRSRGQAQPESQVPSGQQQPSTTATANQAATAASSSSVTPGPAGSLRFAFKNAPIESVIEAVMRELGHSYVIDPQVTGNVSIFTMKEIPKAKLFGVLEQLLKMNGHAIVKQQDFYVVLPIDDAPRIPHDIFMKPAQSEEGAGEETSEEGEEEAAPQAGQNQPAESETPPAAAALSQAGESAANPSATQTAEEAEPVEEPTVRDSVQQLEDSEGLVTYVIPLNYIPTDQMLTLVQVFVSGGATVVNFQPFNMLLVTDFRQNILQILNLVELLDTQYFDINTVDLIPIRFNNAVDVAEDLGQVFAPGDKAAGIRFVAIERLNSILVVTRTPTAFTEVTKWIAKLDAPASTSNLKTYVYQVENNTAVQIAQILAELYQDGFGLPSMATGEGVFREQEGQTAQGRLGQPGQQVPSREAGFVPGSRLQGQGAAGFPGGTVGSQAQSGNLLNSLGPQLASGQSQIRAITAGNLKIVVNEFNNSLIIQGTEADIQFVLDTIKQLDTLPRQVLIEAKIYSVELNDNLSFGVTAFLQERGTGIQGGEGGSGTLGEGQPATVGSITSGGISIASRAFIGSERELVSIVDALREKTNVEIVEAPRLVALDGVPASINIGAEVPVTTASFGNPLTTGNTSFVNSIQFRSTGTTLLVIPRISASGIVQMEISIEVSSPSGTPLTPTINRNFVNTSLIVRDGQTAGIAGLISDSLNVGKSRVPVLGDIPIVGALFGTTTKSDRRFELIFFITPRVITSLPTAAELTVDFKRALRNTYDYIQRMEQQEEALIQQRRQRELEQQREP